MTPGQHLPTIDRKRTWRLHRRYVVRCMLCGRRTIPYTSLDYAATVADQMTRGACPHV